MTSNNLIVGNHPDTNNNTNNITVAEGTTRTGDIILNASGNVLLGDLTATGSVTVYTSGGNIQDNTVPEDPNIVAQNIALNAPSGNIGSVVNDVNIDLTASVLSATAQGGIYITENDSDMILLEVTATAGNVELTTNGGSILDMDPGNDILPNISGWDIVLNAPGGSIGSTVIGEDIDVDVAPFGTLSATADGVIYIEELAGDISAKLIQSNSNDVNLTTLTGNFFDGQAGDVPNIAAQNITLNAPSGTVGQSGFELFIDLAASQLDVSAQNGVYITEVDSKHCSRLYQCNRRRC